MAASKCSRSRITGPAYGRGIPALYLCAIHFLFFYSENCCVIQHNDFFRIRSCKVYEKIDKVNNTVNAIPTVYMIKSLKKHVCNVTQCRLLKVLFIKDAENEHTRTVREINHWFCVSSGVQEGRPGDCGGKIYDQQAEERRKYPPPPPHPPPPPPWWPYDTADMAGFLFWENRVFGPS